MQDQSNLISLTDDEYKANLVIDQMRGRRVCTKCETTIEHQYAFQAGSPYRVFKHQNAFYCMACAAVLFPKTYAKIGRGRMCSYRIEGPKTIVYDGDLSAIQRMTKRERRRAWHEEQRLARGTYIESWDEPPD